MSDVGRTFVLQKTSIIELNNMIHKHQHFDLLGKIILERMIFTPPLSIPGKLENESCLLYPVEGHSTLYNSDVNLELKRNDAVFMKCGNYFNKWHENKDKSMCEVVAIHFYPEVIEYVYGTEIPSFISAERKSGSEDIQLIEKHPLIKHFVDGLLVYFENATIVDEGFLILKIKELLSLLFKLNHNNIRELMLDMFNPNELNFKQTIEANIYEDLSIEALAHLSNLSLSSFKRKFSDVYGTSPKKYIVAERLKKAKSLLESTDLSVKEISYKCGFGDVNYFSRSFKMHYDMSPSECKISN